MEATKAKGKLFYGWFIVIGCMLLAGAGTGIAANCVGVFISPVSEALGVSRTQFSLYTTFASLAMMCMSPVIGSIFDKYNFKRLLVVGALVGASSFFVYSMATTVWHFYLMGTIHGLFMGFMTGIPIALLINRWFIDKKGLAIGIAYAGSGLSATILVPIVSVIIENYGWRFGYRVLSLAFLLMTIPTIIFLVKVRPEDLGLQPLGAEKLATAKTSTSDSAPVVRQGLTRSQAVKTPAFYFLCIACAMISFIGLGTQQHIVSYLTDVGYEPTLAASMYSLMMAVLIGGKIILGSVYDRFGIRIGTFYVCGLLCLSEICLIIAGASTVVIMVFAVAFGLANAMQTITTPLFINQLFGDREYASIMGACMPFLACGGALGVPFSAFIYDTFGSYTYAWYGYGIGSIVMMILFLLAINSAAKARAKLAQENA